MNEDCYRCGAEIRESGGGFCCPNCGSPQLSLATTTLNAAAGESTTGEQPPPKPRLLEWRVALRCSAEVSAGALVLFLLASYLPVMTLGSLLWVAGAPFLAIALYRRRVPERKMNGAVGARIGLTVGTLMGAALATALSGIGLVARYVLHAMGPFDAEIAQRMREQIARSAAANPLPADALQQMMSTEFRTGVMLFTLLILLGSVLVFSTLSGAFAGMVQTPRSRAAQ